MDLRAAGCLLFTLAVLCLVAAFIWRAARRRPLSAWRRYGLCAACCLVPCFPAGAGAGYLRAVWPYGPDGRFLGSAPFQWGEFAWCAGLGVVAAFVLALPLSCVAALGGGYNEQAAVPPRTLPEVGPRWSDRHRKQAPRAGQGGGPEGMKEG
jgi:hypothetical protein